jgi:hypothetical protein
VLNISLKFHDINSRGSEDMNRTRNTWLNLQTPLVTLTLSRPGWNMGSAHRLDGETICLKFHEIPSRG